MNVRRPYIVPYNCPLQEWSKRIKSAVNVRDGMTPVPQQKFDCDCKSKKQKKREDL